MSSDRAKRAGTIGRAFVAALTLASLSFACSDTSRPASGPSVSPPPPSAAPSSSGTSMNPPIVQTGATVLRARASEVPAEKIQTAEMTALVARMIDTMRKAPGVGLAAPQIGVPLRVIVLEDRAELLASLTPEEKRERLREPFETRVFFNPVLTPVGEDKATFFEGCLSVKGYVALVERSLEVEVSGLDREAKPQTWRIRGWPARILQHEVDHLDGTLYIDRMKSRSFATADQAKALYSGKPIGEVRQLLGL